MIYENGDLVKKFKNKEFDGIAHGCNCFHAMNSGIAKTIREEFASAHKADIATRFGDHTKLGKFSIATAFPEGLIFNLYTQNRPGSQSDVIDELYENIKNAFLNLNSWIKRYKEKMKMDKFVLGIPKIGAGIAGGDWKKIEGIITSSMTEAEVHLVNYVPDAIDLFDLNK